MIKRLERILQLEDVKQKDVIVFKYAGKQEKYIVQEIDNFAIRAVGEEGKPYIRIFPKSNLISDNWYVEKEGNPNPENYTIL